MTAKTTRVMWKFNPPPTALVVGEDGTELEGVAELALGTMMGCFRLETSVIFRGPRFAFWIRGEKGARGAGAVRGAS